MTLPGLVMLVLSQVVMVLVVSLSLFLVIDDFVEESAQFLGGATALAVIVVDALVLTGVIGRGWPPSTETNTELLLGSFVGAALLILAVGIEEDEVGAVATGIVGLILIGLGEGLLLAGLIWPQHHVTAEPPTLGATTAPGRTPAPTVTVIRTVTATPVSAPAPTVTVVRTVTAAPGHAPTPTVTVTQTVKGTPGSAPTTANPAPAANQSPSGAVTAAIAVAGAGGTLLGGLGTLLVGWVAIAERRKNSEKTPAPPP